MHRFLPVQNAYNCTVILLLQQKKIHLIKFYLRMWHQQYSHYLEEMNLIKLVLSFCLLSLKDLY